MTFPLIAIAGTHGLDDVWWQPGSAWCEEAKRHGLAFLAEKDPFRWSTALDGIVGKNSTWASVGASLRWYVGKYMPHGVPHDRVNIVAHSHGGQVAAYALAEGLLCHTLITVGTPVRADMKKVWRAARPNITNWIHIRAGIWDFWQLLGGLMDGAFSLKRDFDLADANIVEPTRTHGGLLGPALWTNRGWWAFLADSRLPGTT